MSYENQGQIQHKDLLPHSHELAVHEAQLIEVQTVETIIDFNKEILQLSEDDRGLLQLSIDLGCIPIRPDMSRERRDRWVISHYHMFDRVLMSPLLHQAGIHPNLTERPTLDWVDKEFPLKTRLTRVTDDIALMENVNVRDHQRPHNPYALQVRPQLWIGRKSIDSFLFHEYYKGQLPSQQAA